MQASYEQILQTIIRGVVYTYKFPMQTTRQHRKSNAFEIPESLLTITQMVRVHISSMVKGFFLFQVIWWFVLNQFINESAEY